MNAYRATMQYNYIVYLRGYPGLNVQLVKSIPAVKMRVKLFHGIIEPLALEPRTEDRDVLDSTREARPKIRPSVREFLPNVLGGLSI